MLGMQATGSWLVLTNRAGLQSSMGRVSNLDDRIERLARCRSLWNSMEPCSLAGSPDGYVDTIALSNMLEAKRCDMFIQEKLSELKNGISLVCMFISRDLSPITLLPQVSNSSL